ncbi:hypothetical protein HPB47_023334 [Ixodes persulcatus]|uniref:Uncharacterized protein n=1 Tax=Ixodes persulcatus TaxID=34615 RepID=A0AC60Q943_IXOPE|nr:hypothetical protein HPB47_023334 [Ixodes persulcatus]
MPAQHASRALPAAPAGCASTALTQQRRLRPPLSLLSQTYLSFGQGGHRACAKCEDRGRLETRALPRGRRAGPEGRQRHLAAHEEEQNPGERALVRSAAAETPSIMYFGRQAEDSIISEDTLLVDRSQDVRRLPTRSIRFYVNFHSPTINSKDFSDDARLHPSRYLHELALQVDWAPLNARRGSEPKTEGRHVVPRERGGDGGSCQGCFVTEPQGSPQRAAPLSPGGVAVGERSSTAKRPQTRHVPDTAPAKGNKQQGGASLPSPKEWSVAGVATVWPAGCHDDGQRRSKKGGRERGSIPERPSVAPGTERRRSAEERGAETPGPCLRGAAECS